MWFLLMILLSTVHGANTVTVLNTFSTYEACQPERHRVGFAMAESYPYENNFIIVCNFRDNGPKVLLRKLPRYGAGVKEATAKGELFQQSDVAPVTRLTIPPGLYQVDGYFRTGAAPGSSVAASVPRAPAPPRV